jgi:GNAT superfamily N-acetyltransferase
MGSRLPNLLTLFRAPSLIAALPQTVSEIDYPDAMKPPRQVSPGQPAASPQGQGRAPTPLEQDLARPSPQLPSSVQVPALVDAAQAAGDALAHAATSVASSVATTAADAVNVVSSVGRLWRAYVPIRSLGPAHADRVAWHLKQLDERDRYLRFGFPAQDNNIDGYVDRIDWAHDEVFGVFNRKLELVAMAHLAYGDASKTPRNAEFGVSVLKSGRGKGLGSRLFERAVMHARNHGVALMYIHALTENTAMLKIAANAGASIEREGGEADAYLKLPPETMLSNVQQMFEEQAATMDYALKANAKLVNDLVDGFAETKQGIREVRRKRLE